MFPTLLIALILMYISPFFQKRTTDVFQQVFHIWAASSKKVPNDLSRYHAYPSFGMIITIPDQTPVYLVYTVRTLALYSGVIQCTATLEVNWFHYSVCTVYTASVRPVYTLSTLEFGLD